MALAISGVLSVDYPICRRSELTRCGVADQSFDGDFVTNISDYIGVDPLFGAMEDFDALVKRPMMADSRSSSIWCEPYLRTSTRGYRKPQLAR